MRLSLRGFLFLSPFFEYEPSYLRKEKGSAKLFIYYKTEGCDRMSSRTIWDKNGNKIGEDVTTTDRDGLICITHYDTGGNRVGRSFQTRDHRGDIYMIHEDARGNRIGRSTVERDWWGDYYVKTDWVNQAEPVRKETQRSIQTDSGTTEEDSAGDILFGIAGIIVKVFFWIFIGSLLYGIVMAVGCTVWMYLLLPALNNSPLLSKVGPGIIIVVAPVFLAYMVYLGIMLVWRFQKKITWKDFLLGVLRWAVIGPFAFRKIIRQKRGAQQQPGKGKPKASVIPDSVKATRCSRCGRAYGAEDRFCKYCGEKIEKENEYVQ